MYINMHMEAGDSVVSATRVACRTGDSVPKLLLRPQFVKQRL